MSSELTIDIQLTELGFSSWDFQLLNQKETHQTSDLEHASSPSSPSSSSSPSSACPVPVETHVDEETNVGQNTFVCPNSAPSDQGSRVQVNLFPVDSTETSTEISSKTVCEKEGGHVGEKRRKGSESDDDDDDEHHVKKEKKKKMRTEQRSPGELRERGAKRKLMSDVEVSGEEEEEEEEEEEDGGDDYDLTDDEEADDALSSDTNGSEEHRCQVCNLTFSSTFLLHEHLHLHNGVRLYCCAECGKQFCHLANYRRHLRSHAKVSTVQCVICTAQFATQEDLQHHLDTNHFEDKFYQCDLCKRIFTSMTECKKHVRLHKRYQCHKCERRFRHRSSLIYHLKKHNKDVFVCTDCGLAFSKKAALLRHSFYHLGLLPYTCVRCKRHFRLSSQYVKHECKPEQLQCIACLVVFKSQDDFQKHKKDTGCWGHQTTLSAKTNDIRCMECGQVFDSSEELKKHAGTHQRVMKCSECGMGFRSSIMLMSHMGGHAAKRPCLCKECGLGFSHQQAYDSHLKTCGLVSPAEAASKKPKPTSKKKEAAVTPKSIARQAAALEIRTVPQIVQLPPAALVGDQTKPSEGLGTFTVNKEPLSSVPLVVFLPVPSTSASENIQSPQKLDSEVSKKSLLVPQVIHVPLSSNRRSLSKGFDKSVLLQDIASPVSGSNILKTSTTGNNAKTRWTVLEHPCSSGSVTETCTVKTEQAVADLKLKPTLQFVQLNAGNEQKKKVLSSLEILQVLNTMKKNVCTDEKKATPPSLTTAASDNAEKPLCLVKIKTDHKYTTLSGSRLEEHISSLKMSSDAQLTTNVEKYLLGDVKMESHSPDIGSPEITLDNSQIKKKAEEDQIPEPLIRSSLTFSSVKPAELWSKGKVQKTDKPAEEEDSTPSSSEMEIGNESDVVQCDTCGKIILEKNLVQHATTHSVSSVQATA